MSTFLSEWLHGLLLTPSHNHKVTGIVQIIQLPLALNQIVVIMAKFNMQEMLDVIYKYKCDELWLVPRKCAVSALLHCGLLERPPVLHHILPVPTPLSSNRPPSSLYHILPLPSSLYRTLVFHPHYTTHSPFPLPRDTTRPSLPPPSSQCQPPTNLPPSQYQTLLPLPLSQSHSPPTPYSTHSSTIPQYHYHTLHPLPSNQPDLLLQPYSSASSTTPSHPATPSPSCSNSIPAPPL